MPPSERKPRTTNVSQERGKDQKTSRRQQIDVGSEAMAIEKKRKKSKRREQDTEDQEESMNLKSRKRKRVLEAASTEEKNEESFEKPKKKKHKNKTGLLDPSDDTTLSEQAQKALSYAFTQIRHPKRWKFQKAKQNWLIRNVWSTANIPESHMPLVLKYLSNVQGGVRESLIKTCKTNLSPAAAPTEDEPAPQTSSQTTKETLLSKDDAPTPPTPPTTNVKAERARALLDVLSPGDEATSS